MSTTSTQHDGGPAFPHNKELSDGSFSYHSGMTLRDWFAGQALNGMLSESDDYSFEGAAKASYEQADAMLAERSKK